MKKKNLMPGSVDRKFAETYITSVRDHVLGVFMEKSMSNSFPELRPGFRAAIASMNEAQRASMHTLIAWMVDLQSVRLMLMTSLADAPWSIVKRDRAIDSGLESLSSGFSVEGEFFEWVAKYSGFTYNPQDRKKQFLERMKQIEDIFFEHMDEYESFKPEFEGAQKIRVEMQKMDWTRRDVDNVISIANEVADSEHHHGTGWRDYLSHVQYLFAMDGFFVDVDKYTGEMTLGKVVPKKSVKL